MNALFCQYELAHAIVVKSDYRVSQHRQFVKCGLRLVFAALAFETKRHGCKNNDEGTLLTRDAHNQRRRARSGAPTQANTEKNHFSSPKRVTNLGLRLLRGASTQLGIPA